MKAAVSKPVEVIALYELRISVEPTGILIRLNKYAVKFTGKNYCPVRITDEMEDQKFHHGLTSRVPVEEVNKVRRVSFHDNPTHIGRNIYFLDGPGNQEKAVAAVKAEIEQIVTKMKKDMDECYRAWTERIMRPPRQSA